MSNVSTVNKLSLFAHIFLKYTKNESRCSQTTVVMIHNCTYSVCVNGLNVYSVRQKILACDQCMQILSLIEMIIINIVINKIANKCVCSEESSSY